MKNGLWSVMPAATLSEGSALYIIASTLKIAASKAERWLKKNGYNQRLKEVKFKGTVDVL
jgi:hypothetical protein